MLLTKLTDKIIAVCFRKILLIDRKRERVQGVKIVRWFIRFRLLCSHFNQTGVLIYCSSGNNRRCHRKNDAVDFGLFLFLSNAYFLFNKVKWPWRHVSKNSIKTINVINEWEKNLFGAIKRVWFSSLLRTYLMHWSSANSINQMDSHLLSISPCMLLFAFIFGCRQIRTKKKSTKRIKRDASTEEEPDFNSWNYFVSIIIERASIKCFFFFSLSLFIYFLCFCWSYNICVLFFFNSIWYRCFCLVWSFACFIWLLRGFSFNFLTTLPFSLSECAHI